MRNLEQEYQRWVKMVFGEAELSPAQLQTMRDAFFAGALIGCFSADYGDSDSIKSQVGKHISSRVIEDNLKLGLN